MLSRIADKYAVIIGSKNVVILDDDAVILRVKMSLLKVLIVLISNLLCFISFIFLSSLSRRSRIIYYFLKIVFIVTIFFVKTNFNYFVISSLDFMFIFLSSDFIPCSIKFLIICCVIIISIKPKRSIRITIIIEHVICICRVNTS